MKIHLFSKSKSETTENYEESTHSDGVTISYSKRSEKVTEKVLIIEGDNVDKEFAKKVYYPDVDCDDNITSCSRLTKEEN